MLQTSKYRCPLPSVCEVVKVFAAIAATRRCTMSTQQYGVCPTDVTVTSIDSSLVD